MKLTGLRGRSWAALGASVGGLGRSWGLCCRSWAALGAYVRDLGSLLGPLLAVLGRSWDLCGRSWAALGAYVGGPGPSWVEKWPGPKLEDDLQGGSGPKSGPNPSGSRVPKGAGPLKPRKEHKAHKRLRIFFYRYGSSGIPPGFLHCSNFRLFQASVGVLHRS